MEDTAGTTIEQLARWADAMTRTLDSWDTGTLIVLAVTLTVLAGVTGRATTGGDKHEPVFAVDVTNRQGEVVATVEKTLYVRRKPGR